MVEAGTGVGKSFAYLVPAILAATAQQGLPRRRLHAHHQPAGAAHPQGHPVPADRDAAAVPRRAGQGPRRNYLSLRRLRVAQQRVGALLAEDAAVGAAPADRPLVAADAGRQPQRPAASSRCRAVWDLVESDSGNCLGRKCPDYEDCFYFKARRRMLGAQLLDRQSRPVLQRPGPAPRRRQPAARLQGRHLRRGPHAGGRGRRPPGPAGQPRRPSTTCSTSCSTARHRPRPARRPPRAARRVDQVDATRAAAERFFDDVAGLAAAAGGSGRAQPAPRSASASPASSPTRSPRS